MERDQYPNHNRAPYERVFTLEEIERFSKTLNSNGYIYCKIDAGVWEAEHRLIMTSILGRPLTKGEVVHHKNRNYEDNRAENLEVRMRDGSQVKSTKAIFASANTMVFTLIEIEKMPQRITKDNYIYRKINNTNGWEAEHRLITTTILNRPLKPGESVHHKDGNRNNNSPDNLELWIATGKHRYGQRASDLICPHCEKPYFESSQKI